MMLFAFCRDSGVSMISWNSISFRASISSTYTRLTLSSIPRFLLFFLSSISVVLPFSLSLSLRLSPYLLTFYVLYIYFSSGNVYEYIVDGLLWHMAASRATDVDATVGFQLGV